LACCSRLLAKRISWAFRGFCLIVFFFMVKR
jgi:hypothetical protein